MTNNFTLSPALVRELGYLFNGGQHSGWANRVSEYLGVSPRTVEAWARGERECEGPPALLMAYLARMVVQGTYSATSLAEVEKLLEVYGSKITLDLNLTEVRRGIRSLIKLKSSIKKVSQDVNVNRSALSRWLSGENALGIDSISKVLDHIGLNRSVDDHYDETWRASLAWDNLDEINQNLRDAIKVFFAGPPECLITQVGNLSGRFASIKASLLYRKTTITIEISMPTRLARHDQGLSWLISAFDWVSSLEIYCPLSEECRLDEDDDPVRKLNAGGG